MTLYSFPGYDDEPRTAENALQEWIDTQEINLTDEDTEALYQYTHYQASAEDNIRAIQAGADYVGIDLVALGYPLPTPIPPRPAYTHEVNAALECLAWSEVDSETERPLDSFDAEFAPEVRESIRAELAAFIEANAADLAGMDAAQIGHDFILTRNHHGAGFWDRGLGEVGERLTVAAHAYGEIHAWIDGDTIRTE